MGTSFCKHYVLRLVKNDVVFNQDVWSAGLILAKVEFMAFIDVAANLDTIQDFVHIFPV